MSNHYAIQITDHSDKDACIRAILKGAYADLFPELTDKRGVLFSTITLQNLIQEEYQHEHITLSAIAGKDIRTKSSGEQLKVLFTYLLSLNPDFMILDNPFDCLDVASVKTMKEKLLSLSASRQFIQFFNRKADILSFITHVIEVEDNRFSTIQSLAEYHAKQTETATINVYQIPASPHAYDAIPEVLIEMKDVNVSYYEKKVLHNINWKIQRGEFWQLVGPNGSGKTTLLSMIYGNNTKAYGQNIYLFGRKKGSGESVWDIKEKIGYFSPALTDFFSRRNTVLQMVVSGLYDTVGLYQKPSYLEKKTAEEWLQVIGLSDEKDVSFQQISLVKQRMVLIARAMIKHPPVLILDEPSTGLNDQNAALLSRLINKIAKETNTAILYVSHRKEPGLSPDHVLELQMTEEGSVGVTKIFDSFASSNLNL